MIPGQYAHNPQVQEPNRAYAGYYLPQMYSENYRVQDAEDLEMLPDGSIIVEVGDDGSAVPYQLINDRWQSRHHWFTHSQMLPPTGRHPRLFVVYRPDLVKRRDGA
jgi:hypothetical protein